MTAKGRKRNSVALDIATELCERGVSGQLSVIVEGMPVGATLSAGTNNWDKTWSLSAKDLDGLKFYTPEGSGGDHVVAVRVLCFDDDGFEVANTVALFDMTVHAPRSGSNAADAKRVAQEKLAAATAEWKAAAAERLVEAKAKWEVEAEKSLAAARKAWENKTAQHVAAAKKKWKPEAAERLSCAKAQWKAAESERIAVAKASWAEDETQQLSALKATWQAEAQARSNDLKADWQAAAQKRLATDKTAWQKEEERQLAAEKANWDRQAGERLAAAKAAWEPLAEQRMATADVGWKAELDQKLAEAKARWRTEEEKQLAQARTAWESERDRGNRATRPQSAANIEDTLAAARSVWEAETEQRLSEVEAQWRADVERRVNEIRAAFDNEARKRLKKAAERWKAAEEARFAAAKEAWQAEAENDRHVAVEERPVPTAKPPAENDRHVAVEERPVPAAKPPAENDRHVAVEERPVPAAKPPAENARSGGKVESDADWLTAAAKAPSDEPDPEWQRETIARRAAADAKQEIEVAKKDTQTRRKQAKIEIWRKTEERHRKTTAQVKKLISGPRTGRWRAAAALFCVGLAVAGIVQMARTGTDPRVVLDRVTAASRAANQARDQGLLYVRAESAIVRAAASSESTALNSLPRDTAIRELRRSGNWVQVALPGSDEPLGWMHATLLRTEIAATR